MHLVYSHNFAGPLSSISFGRTVIPRRNWKQWLSDATFWGIIKVQYYGLCENDKFELLTMTAVGFLVSNHLP